MAIALGMRIPDALRPWSADSLVGFAQEVGLETLDLPADFAAGAAACAAAGLRVGTVDGAAMGALVSPDESTRTAAVASITGQVAAMAEVGAHVLFLCLVPGTATQSIAQSLDLFEESFPAVARACEANDVRIAFEGWPGPAPLYPTLGYTPEVWRAMFAAVPSPALGLCFDPSHLVRLGIDYLRVLEEFGERIYHCHGKDTAALPEAQYLYGHGVPALSTAPRYSGGAWRYCVPGAGCVDWAAIAYGLERLDYTGSVCIELEDARYTGSAEAEQQGVRKALSHLALHFR